MNDNSYSNAICRAQFCCVLFERIFFRRQNLNISSVFSGKHWHQANTSPQLPITATMARTSKAGASSPQKKTSRPRRANNTAAKGSSKRASKTRSTSTQKNAVAAPKDSSQASKKKSGDDDSVLECTVPDFQEPEIPWAESKARELLRQDIIDEVVPREPCASMPSNVIFTSRPEYAEYGYADFCNRLSRLRAQVKRDIKRTDEDLAAFLNFKANNPIHKITAHGYPEWDGSYAQKCLKKDIGDGLHEMLEPQELWLYREEYDDFPLKVFKDHIYQEVKTRKYFHTLEVKGKSNTKPGRHLK